MSELGYLSCVLPVAFVVVLVLAVCALAACMRSSQIDQQEE